MGLSAQGSVPRAEGSGHSARGSGRSANEVAGLIKQFKQTQKMMRSIGKMPGIRQMFGSGRKQLEDKIQQAHSSTKQRRKRRRGF